jgi:hypothetical protein
MPGPCRVSGSESGVAVDSSGSAVCMIDYAVYSSAQARRRLLYRIICWHCSSARIPVELARCTRCQQWKDKSPSGLDHNIKSCKNTQLPETSVVSEIALRQLALCLFIVISPFASSAAFERIGASALLLAKFSRKAGAARTSRAICPDVVRRRRLGPTTSPQADATSSHTGASS